MLSKIYFTNVYHGENKTSGDNKIYSISAYTLAEDEDNFYLTIPKSNQDETSGIEMYLSPISLIQMLEKGTVMVVNEKQICQLPSNLTYDEFISLTKEKQERLLKLSQNNTEKKMKKNNKSKKHNNRPGNFRKKFQLPR